MTSSSNSAPRLLLTGRKIIFHQLDLRDTTLVEAILRDEHIDTVLHLGGLKAVGESCEQPLRYYDSNVLACLRLMQAMAAANVSLLEFSSSATFYGDPQFLSYTEAHPAYPTNPYGQIKCQIEIMLQDLSNSQEGWHFSVPRYFNSVGAHPSGELGEDPREIPNDLMPYLAQVAVGKRDFLTIHGDDYDTNDGAGVRDYLYASDLADGHWAALQHLLGRASPEFSSCDYFNLGSGVGHSMKDMLHAFERACGKPLPVRVGPRRPGDLPEFLADASRSRNELHWQPARDLDTMCSSTWQ